MRLLLSIIIMSLALSTPARAVSTLILPPTPSPSPTPTPSPSPTPDPVLEQAQREAKLADELKKKAVADKERAEAEAARLKALVQPLGAPANVAVPTGSVTTDAAGWVESQMLAKEAARQITRQLTLSLCTQPITPGAPLATAQKVKTIVMHSPSDLAGVELYGSIMGQLENLRDELKKKNSEAQGFLTQTDPTRAPVTRAPVKSTTEGDMERLSLAVAAPGIATGIIKSVAELLNLFRTDTSFTNQAITLNENTIISHIVRSFNVGVATGSNCAGPVRVYHPALYTPLLLSPSKDSAIIRRLNEVEAEKVEAAGNVEKLDARIKLLKDLSAAFKSRKEKSEAQVGKEKDKARKDEEIKTRRCKSRRRQGTPECQKLLADSKALGEEIAQLEKDIKKLNDDLKDFKADPANFKDWVDNLTALRAKTQALITATELISAKLNKPDDATKLTALAQLIRAERLHGILIADGAYTLHVEVKANGTTKVKKNLFVDAKVRHSAGADLTYQLIEGGGVIAQAQELKCYIQYRSARDIQDMVSGTGDKKVVCNFADDTAEPPDNDRQRLARRKGAQRAESER